MATYFTDFSGYTTGAQPSDWTQRFGTTEANWTTTDDAAATGGKVLRISHNSNGRTGLSWDAIDADAARENVEVVFKTRFLTSIDLDHQIRGMGRAFAGGAGEVNAYTGGVTDTDRFLQKYVADVSSNLGTASAWTPAADTWYWVRFRINGSNIYVRQWADGTAEDTATWTVTSTDTDLTADGWVGLFLYHSGAHPGVDIDVLGVGTNGDTAPTSSGTTPTISSVTNPVKPGDTATVTGSNFTNVTGGTFAGVSVTTTVVDSSTVTFTVPDAYANNLKFNSVTVTLTDGTNSDSTTTQFNPPTGWSYIDLTSVAASPSFADAVDASSTATLAAGDQIVYQNTSQQDAAVTITGRADATAKSSATGTHKFDMRMWDATDSTWSGVTTAMVTNDTAAPVIDLVGGNETVLVNSTWSDPGYSATDNVDASVTVNRTGTVDTSIVGDYTLTYDASDVAGNAATQKTRIVSVVNELPKTKNRRKFGIGARLRVGF